jgi:hypothetical protein
MYIYIYICICICIYVYIYIYKYNNTTANLIINTHILIHVFFLYIFVIDSLIMLHFLPSRIHSALFSDFTGGVESMVFYAIKNEILNCPLLPQSFLTNTWRLQFMHRHKDSPVNSYQLHAV